MSVKIEDEDDLLVEIGRKFWASYRKFFPKITIISRNIQVIPDIDLLEINTEYPPPKYEPLITTVGYEVKLLKYRKRWKRVPYELFYQGLGEALCYYQYGIEQVQLILGIHHEMPTEAYKSFLNKLSDLMVVWMPILKDYLGLIIWDTGDGTYKEIRSLSKKFPIDQMNDDLKHKRNCLIRGEFVYDKKLFEAIRPVTYDRVN